jgi:hypothetical protein
MSSHFHLVVETQPNLVAAYPLLPHLFFPLLILILIVISLPFPLRQTSGFPFRVGQLGRRSGTTARSAPKGCALSAMTEGLAISSFSLGNPFEFGLELVPAGYDVALAGASQAFIVVNGGAAADCDGVAGE